MGNKIKVGDEVLYLSLVTETFNIKEEAKIFGIASNKDKLDRKYAISYIHEGPYGEKEIVHKIVSKNKLEVK